MIDVAPTANAQLLFDCDTWTRAHIPHLNSFSYGLHLVLVLYILAAVYFIRSAVRAQRNLSTSILIDRTSNVPTVRTNTMRRAASSVLANKVAMRRLVRRVFSSGCLMLAITVVLAVGTYFIFHPVGFTTASGLLYPIIMANSLLQIESFAPARGAPTGPLQEAMLSVASGIRRLGLQCERWLASSSAVQPSALVKVARARQDKRFSVLDRHGDNMLGSLQRRSQEREAPAQALARAPRDIGAEIERCEQIEQQDKQLAEADSNNELKPWERPGVSIRFLEAFVRTHAITPDMSTTDVMERIIKPETTERKCCYVELIEFEGADRCPSEWLGKATHFASHWQVLLLFISHSTQNSSHSSRCILHVSFRWGYKFLDLVAALRTYSATCPEMPFFFLDTMAINQHTFFLGSTSTQANQAELLEGLHLSLQACGNLLLCCMAGPGGEPGWMSPAPFKRIW